MSILERQAEDNCNLTEIVRELTSATEKLSAEIKESQSLLAAAQAELVELRMALEKFVQPFHPPNHQCRK